MRQFVKNQSSALYSTGWTKAKVESFTDAQLKEEFEKIQKALANTQVQAFSRTLKRTGPELEEPSSKQQKSTEAPIPSVPDVPQPPVGSSPKSSGTRRKSLGRNRLTKPKSILKELDLDVDDKTFIKVVSDEDSTDEAPILWSALAGSIEVVWNGVTYYEKPSYSKLEVVYSFQCSCLGNYFWRGVVHVCRCILSSLSEAHGKDAKAQLKWLSIHHGECPYWEPKDWLVLSKRLQFNKAMKTANYMVLEGVLMKNKDATAKFIFQSSRLSLLPTGRVLGPGRVK
ncbi:hypothetical protein Tco_0599366 [Tanacetum coccineum]